MKRLTHLLPPPTICRIATRPFATDRLTSLKEKLNLDGPTVSQFAEKPTYFVKRNEAHPYLDPSVLDGQGKKVYMETYGCQMNVNDTEIASTILKDHGYSMVSSDAEADVIFLMTCAIREGAEDKIWKRLRSLKKLKKSGKVKQIGLLGCVAERLKGSLLEKEDVLDVIAGPDAYRDLPKLLAVNDASGMSAVNVLLSLDETYADVRPVVSGRTSTFVSIMRGCDNMCSYCIVPFTRGRERSRPIQSIVDEVKQAAASGVKEVTLLGQNVNSYRDKSVQVESPPSTVTGFKTLYKDKSGGLTFDVLLEAVACVDPEVRIRFTSPHPKDFPDRVLDMISRFPNICKSIHLPAQSGSNRVLERMRRGYTRETYLELVKAIRDKIPQVTLTSDFISGFCGETEEDHEATLDLIRQVGYNFVYHFGYSMRGKTHASHHFEDDVPTAVKNRRVQEICDLFRSHAEVYNRGLIGSHQLVLVEGPSLRSKADVQGRSDGNIRVVFPQDKLPNRLTGSEEVVGPGHYVAVEVTSATSQSLKGRGLYIRGLNQE